ncbi:MAG TPA: bifunctional hydroxymethylpyrimidine kinase/phosphomethylpyrimidine kinase [Terriglobales bacterium]|nr:bifunctional hydroxymethylpyrimidine kinase/phosphomethylpyrimidine kinase [Terriglobales bacterium]
MNQTPPVILSIAGFDPTSGAGTTADIKTIAAHGCYGVACITALTVQSTTGVRRVEPVPAKLVRDTLRELAADMPIAAVRIGMLASDEVVAAVVDFLQAAKIPHVVLDPVLRSTSGSPLLDKAGIERMQKQLLPLVSVITPNIEEAGALAGMKVTNLEEMHAAAAKLHKLGARQVIVTGGHLEKAVDLVSVAASNGTPPEQIEFGSDRLRSTSTHGTGCAFATALAVNLAQGKQLQDAAVLAKAYVTKAIARAYPLGKGSGPVHHLFRMDEQPRPAADAVEPKH